MDSGGVPEGTWSLEEGGATRLHLQQTTPSGGLRPSSVLRHYMCGQEHPLGKTQRKREVWTGTPILKRDFGYDNGDRVDRQLISGDLFVPTEVIVDTPLAVSYTHLTLPTKA